MNRSRDSAAGDAEPRAFWPDKLVASFVGWLLIGGLVLRVFAPILLLGAAILTSAGFAIMGLKRDPADDISAGLGLALICLYPAFWTTRELYRGTKPGHVWGAVLGILAPLLGWIDGYLGFWILLLPLTIYCLARLLFWGPKPQ